MHSLQTALRKHQPDWLQIGGDKIVSDAIPWFWLYTHAEMAVACHRQKRPFIVGPNMLFCNSRKPRQHRWEQIICDSPYCRLIFTESQNYADMIRENLGKHSPKNICVVPYPVTLPTEDLHRPVDPTRYDALIYVKSGVTDRTVTELELSFPRHITFRYGHYERDQLTYAARCSKVALWLSDDDRGPIGCAEILLTGCPVVGIDSGCPWIGEIPCVGRFVDELDCTLLISRAQRVYTRYDRQEVRKNSAAFFSPDRIVPIVLSALNDVR